MTSQNSIEVYPEEIDRLLDQLLLKENEIARLIVENLRLKRELKNRPFEICPYDIDGCVLETASIGPCLCVN